EEAVVMGTAAGGRGAPPATLIGMGQPERRVWPAGWWPDAVAVLGVVVLTVAVNAGHLLALDLWVRDWCAAHDAADPVMAVLNYLGQGGFFTGVCALLAIYWAVRLRSVRPLLPVATAFVLSFVVLTVIKDWTNRPAPRAAVPHPEAFGAG